MRRCPKHIENQPINTTKMTTKWLFSGSIWPRKQFHKDFFAGKVSLYIYYKWPRPLFCYSLLLAQREPYYFTCTSHLLVSTSSSGFPPSRRSTLVGTLLLGLIALVLAYPPHYDLLVGSKPSSSLLPRRFCGCK